jgi:hypothetical protein
VKLNIDAIEQALDDALPADNGMRSLNGEQYLRDHAPGWLRQLVREVRRLRAQRVMTPTGPSKKRKAQRA